MHAAEPGARAQVLAVDVFGEPAADAPICVRWFDLDSPSPFAKQVREE
jgi:hypothetical protein